MYRILSLTDFSENSKIALDFSKDLASKSESEVFILHAIAPVKGTITLSDKSLELNHILFENAKEKMDELILEFNHLNISPTIIIRSGLLNQLLRHVIEEFKIDLLIINSHGHSNLNKIIGNNAAYILANIYTPTIIIPSNYKTKQIEKASFIHQLEKPKFNHLLDVFNFFDFFGINELDLIHIHSEEQDVFVADKTMIEITQELFPDKTINFHFIEGEFVVDSLALFLKGNHTDFLVISSNKKTFWKRFLAGNIHVESSIKFDFPILILSDAPL
jgi:universal stress protein A